MDNAESLRVFVKAVAFAPKKHRTQRRKDADAYPYINDPRELSVLSTARGGVEGAPSALVTPTVCCTLASGS